jgi:outer membrane biosynthesis protein TonB
MNELSQKDNLKAILGTVLFHLVLLLLFFFFGLRTPLPLPAEEGVMVALGFGDQGIGAFLQQPSAAPAPAATRPQTSPEDVVTQDTDESMAIPPATTQTRPVPTEQPPRPTTTQQTQPQEPQQRPDPRAIFPGSSQTGSTTQSQGTTGQPGSQGDPTGSPTGAPSGSGQGGVSYSLGDRGHQYLDVPKMQPGKFGKVVVTIWVDREGRVTRAVAGARGTTTTDRTLWDLSEGSARRTRFTPKSDAPQEQQGSITYNFVVQ